MIKTRHRLSMLFLALCLLGTFGAFLATATAAQLAQQSEQLRVATKVLEPFVVKNLDGTYRGFSIDLWEEIARRLSMNYEWVDVGSVANQIQSVQDNSADVAIAGISMTPSREELVDFSHPIFRSGGLTQLVGPLFAEDYYGIVLPRNSSLRKPINEALLQIREDGTYEALVTKWFESCS